MTVFYYLGLSRSFNLTFKLVHSCNAHRKQAKWPKLCPNILWSIAEIWKKDFFERTIGFRLKSPKKLSKVERLEKKFILGHLPMNFNSYTPLSLTNWIFIKIRLTFSSRKLKIKLKSLQQWNGWAFWRTLTWVFSGIQ
jgi:hypothetical protein